jgi:predicted nucleic acid-binding protein
VVGELRQGVEGIRRRDPEAARQLDRWLLALVGSYGDRILPVDARVAELWGRLNVPNRLPVVDGLLAATAIVHDLTLVTRNTRHVAKTGALVLDPFDA